MTEEYEEDRDSLFGSPPPSPQIQPQRASSPALSVPSASICDSERRLSTSTDTQNVGTIALPGSHPFSELPINPLASSLNHNTVHRPPAAQPVPTIAKQKIQSWQSHPAPVIKSKGSKKSRQSSQSPLSDVPSRDQEFSLPDPSAPPPAHFLRNQQNLLGKAGLVAGVKPSSITHIRGTTSSNPIIIDDEDTPLLGRRSQSGESHHRYVNPSLLTAPSNEDIVSVLIGQKDIFPVLKGILSLIGKGATQRTPTTSLQFRNDSFKHPPTKRRKLSRVPAGATDWDVPYPFPEGEGPDEYHKTWERERTKHLIGQLVKLIKMAARKAATKNYLARQAAWEKLQQEMTSPVVDVLTDTSNYQQDQSLFNTWMNFLQAFPVAFDAQSQSQSNLASSQASTPGLDDSSSINAMANDSGAITGTPKLPDDFDVLIASMLDSFPQDMESTPIPTPSLSSQPWIIGDDAIDPSLLDLSVQPTSEGVNEDFSMSQAVSPVPSMSSSGGAGPMTPTLSAWEPDIFMGVSGDGGQEGGSWDSINQITTNFLTEGNVSLMVGEAKGKGKEVVGTNPSGCFSVQDATTPTQTACNTLVETQSTDIVSPLYEPHVHPTTIPEQPPPRPQTTISQTRKEEILRRAREKKRKVQEELAGVKTQLWETTIEQAALVHLLKRFDNDRDVVNG